MSNSLQSNYCLYLHQFMHSKSQNPHILYKYFKAKVNMEKELNSIKSELCQNIHFNAYALFKQIDSQSRGRIGIQDLMSFLEAHGLNSTLQEIEGVLQYFTKEVFISLAAFVAALIPKTIEEASTAMSTTEECVVKLILTVIDQNEELKTISKMTEKMAENSFDFTFGILTEFTPQDLIRLYNQFNDRPDGTTFQIVFGSAQSLKWQTVKDYFCWQPANKKRQPRLSEDLFDRKRELQRKKTINTVIMSDSSTDQDSTNNATTNKIKFCTSLDVDIFDRETYLYN